MRLISPLDHRTVQAAITANTQAPFWPFATGAVGWARMGWVRLGYKSGFFDYNAKPVLVGRVEADMGRTVLDLRYRAPLKVYGFLVLWFLFMILPWRILSDAASHSLSLETVGWELGFFLLYLLAPLGVHWFGTLDADQELELLLEFLRQHAKAVPAPV